jgi:hypothetical protein
MVQLANAARCYEILALVTSKSTFITRATRRNIPEDTILHVPFMFCSSTHTNETNSWPLVRKPTIPTERPLLVGQVCINFCGWRDVAWLLQRIPTDVNIGLLDCARYFFHSSSSSIILSRLSGPHFRTNYFKENLVAPEIEPEIPGSVARNSDH